MDWVQAVDRFFDDETVKRAITMPFQMMRAVVRRSVVLPDVGVYRVRGF